MRLKLGIRGHDVPGAPFENIDEFIKGYKQFDLDYLQLVYKKAFRGFEMDSHFLLELADKLKNNDIKVAMIGAYFNMIHPDEGKRIDGIEYFKQCMETAGVTHPKYALKFGLAISVLKHTVYGDASTLSEEEVTEFINSNGNAAVQR